MTSPDVPGLQRLKQRTGNVLCPQPCWLIHKTAGQDVFLEYRRHANDSWSGSARHPYICSLFAALLLSICYLFAICLLSVCHLFAICLLSVCYLFATCLLSVCHLFAICLLSLPSAVKRVRHVSDVYISAPQGCPFRIPFITAC